MRVYNANTEAEITSADTSIHSTIMYALGFAIEAHKYDPALKRDLEAVENILANAETIIVTEGN